MRLHLLISETANSESGVVGHWAVVKHHPGGLGGSGKKKKERGNMSPLVNPPDTQKYLNIQKSYPDDKDSQLSQVKRRNA